MSSLSLQHNYTFFPLDVFVDLLIPIFNCAHFAYNCLTLKWRPYTTFMFIMYVNLLCCVCFSLEIIRFSVHYCWTSWSSFVNQSARHSSRTKKTEDVFFNIKISREIIINATCRPWQHYRLYFKTSQPFHNLSKQKLLELSENLKREASVWY